MANDKRGFPLGLLAAALVYVALRGAILVTAFDAVAMANYELYPMGTLPKALSLGGDYPLHLYYDNAAGQLLTGLLAKLSYGLFGETYLALKLVPATLGLLALGLVWAIADLLWGRRAAALAAMAFALGPTELATKYSLFASGNHFENLFFTCLALYTHYRLQRAPAESRGRWLVVAGFSAGFALFVFLGAIIPVGLVALAHLGIHAWRDALRDLRRWLPAFLLGLAPFVVLNLASRGRGGGFLGAKFGGEGNTESGRVLERMGEFVSKDVFEAGFNGEWLGMGWKVPSALLLGCLAIAWLIHLPAALAGVASGLSGALRWRRSAAEQQAASRRLELAPLVLLAPLATLAFGLSDLRIDRWPAPLEVAGFRYFLPIFLTGILLLGSLARGGAQASGLRRVLLSGGLLVGLLGTGTGLWNLRYLRLDEPQPALGSSYRGFNFVQAARGLAGARNGLDRGQRAALADSFPSHYRRQLYRGLGFHEAQMQIILGQQRSSQRKLLGWIAQTTLEIDDLLSGYPPEMHRAMAVGAGEGLRTLAQSSKESFVALAPHLQRLLASGHELAPLVIEGTAVLQDFPLPVRRTPFLLARNQGLLGNVTAAVRPHVMRGVGRLCGLLLTRGVPQEERQVLQLARSIGAPLRPEFDAGLVAGLEQGSANPAWPAVLNELGPPARLASLRGAFEQL